ncbi:P2Y purinoceptor 14-like isoform X1 [Oreochromis niloticus]|nr:P2Y purinoceptor 14-like isoform X1 [Oreochromis niloticus]XP_025761900.1 P2Y purinoceptor 14-like isoform X1 [Oreochromis niloticus]
MYISGFIFSRNMGDSTNVTSSPNLPPCDVVRTSVHAFFVVVYSLVFLVGLLLNGFIMKFYCCRAQQQASSSLMVYMKNLTAADFLLCLSVPLRISHYASSSPIGQKLYCSFGASTLYLNMYASIIFMGYIAANRYLKIVHPSGTHVLQSVRTAHIVSMVTWVFLLAASITYTILFFITEKPLTSNSIRCDYMLGTSVTLFYKIIHVSCAIIFLVVFICLVFFYYTTSCRVLQVQQSQLASSGSEKLVKSRRNMLVLVSIFCLCFVPYHLVRLPYTILWDSCPAGWILYYLKELATMVSVFNICLDPLVYFYLCKTFRAQVNLRKVLRGKNIQQANQESESRKEQADIVTATS